MARFLREVDPEGRLPEDERARRADLAMRAYMADLTRRRVVSRRKRTAA